MSVPGLKQTLLLACVSAPFALAVPGRAEDARSQAFVQKAAHTNMFEIAAANLATKRGKDNAARQFAQDMIMDHTKAATELETAARAEKITLPTALDPEDDKKLAALGNAPEADFDQAYLSTQVAAHEDAIAVFTAFAKDGPDGPVKNFAVRTIPTLKMHTMKVHGLTDAK